MYPLKFKPILKTVVWGGEKIAPYKEVVTDQHNIGESWELSGVKGHESVIANGEFEGRTITELVEQFKGKLVGEKVYANTGNEFPLLIKFIDAKATSPFRSILMMNWPQNATIPRARPRCGMS